MNLMSTRDFDNYRSLFELMVSFIKPPELLIYLRASVPTLVNQIQKRGRDYEESIRLDYLKSLNDRYEQWIEGYHDGPKLIFNVDQLDFAEKPEALGFIIDQIIAELHGLLECFKFLDNSAYCSEVAFSKQVYMDHQRVKIVII